MNISPPKILHPLFHHHPHPLQTERINSLQLQHISLSEVRSARILIYIYLVLLLTEQIQKSKMLKSVTSNDTLHSANQTLDKGDRTVPYHINKDRQLSKIIDDADKPDIEIEVNNSAKNVNLHCNSGFYSEVALQTFAGFGVNFTKMVGTIQVKCIEHAPSLDQSQLVANLVCKFIINQHTTQLGGVTIHLHNTTRNVQIQGGATMPDGNSAAIWFTVNCIKPWFENLAKNKRLNIDSMNQAISALSSISSEFSVDFSSKICGKCNTKFKGKSKPFLCFYCKKYFHSQSKCKHKCGGISANSQISSTPTTIQSSLQCLASSLASCSLLGQSTSPGTTSVSSTMPSVSTSVSSLTSMVPSPSAISHDATSAMLSVLTTSSSTTATISSVSAVSSVSTVSSLVAIRPSLLPALNHFASPQPARFPSQLPLMPPMSQPPVPLPFAPPLVAVPQAPPPQARPVPQPQRTKNSRTPAITNMEFRAETMEAELNIAKQKIVSQDNLIKDYENKLQLLEERVRLLEKEKHENLYKQHFPQTPLQETLPQPQTHNIPLPPEAPRILTTPQPQSQHISAKKDDLEKIRDSLNEIEAVVLDIKNMVAISKSSSRASEIPLNSIRAPKLGPYRPPSLFRDPRNDTFVKAKAKWNNQSQRRVLLPTPHYPPHPFL